MRGEKTERKNSGDLGITRIFEVEISGLSHLNVGAEDWKERRRRRGAGDCALQIVSENGTTK